MRTAKLFSNGKSQAVRIPAEFRFEGDEVIVKRASGGGLLLLPKIITYEHLETILGKGVDIERGEQTQQERDFSCF
jgi:antitoxin VapB